MLFNQTTFLLKNWQKNTKLLSELLLKAIDDLIRTESWIERYSKTFHSSELNVEPRRCLFVHESYVPVRRFWVHYFNFVFMFSHDLNQFVEIFFVGLTQPLQPNECVLMLFRIHYCNWALSFNSVSSWLHVEKILWILKSIFEVNQDDSSILVLSKASLRDWS